MDNGHDICPSTLEAAVGLYRNLYYGCQPKDKKVLQSPGKPCFILLLHTNRYLGTVILVVLFVCVAKLILLPLLFCVSSEGHLGFYSEQRLLLSGRFLRCLKAGNYLDIVRTISKSDHIHEHNPLFAVAAYLQDSRLGITKVTHPEKNCNLWGEFVKHVIFSPHNSSKCLITCFTFSRFIADKISFHCHRWEGTNHFLWPRQKEISCLAHPVLEMLLGERLIFSSSWYFIPIWFGFVSVLVKKTSSIYVF